MALPCCPELLCFQLAVSDGRCPNPRESFLWVMPGIVQLQCRCRDGVCAWSSDTDEVLSSAQSKNLCKLLMSIAWGLCTGVNLAISICQPSPIRASNKETSNPPFCCAASLAACLRLLLFPVCQVAEPIAFPPGLIQIASPASLHTESVPAVVNRNGSEETPALSGPHLTTASEKDPYPSGAGAGISL